MKRMSAAVACTIALAACTNTDPADTMTPQTLAPGATSETTAAPTTENTEPPVVIPPDGAPTEVSLEADRAFRRAPAGFEDCGSTVLSSGWPTTTAYPPFRNDCILEAVASGIPTQYAYTGRNEAGGMRGTILRVLGPGEILMIEYAVSPAGTITTEETTCAALQTDDDLLPLCA